MAVFNESSIRDGDFEGARMTLEKLENPKLFSRDIYYLWQWEGTMRRRTVYLMYMTDNYRNMGVEEIKKELGKAGLSEEQIMKLERRLRHPTNQQYILEKNLLSGTNNVLTWLLATLACFLLFLLFANMNPSNLLGTSSVMLLQVDELVRAGAERDHPLLGRDRFGRKSR